MNQLEKDRARFSTVRVYRRTRGTGIGGFGSNCLVAVRVFADRAAAEEYAATDPALIVGRQR